MKMPIKKIMFYLSILLSLMMVAVASIGYSAAFLKYLKLPFFMACFLVLLPAIFFRVQKKPTVLREKFYSLHFFLFVLTLVISIISMLTIYLTYPNFFYAQFHLDPYAFYLLPVLLYVLLFFYRQQLKQHWRLMAFFAPILLILLGLLTRSKGYAVFADYFAHEDNWVEYTQFIFYLLASWLSFRTARMLKKRSLVLSTIFLITAFGFFLVAGEEISWGQRILGIETPEQIAQNNTQSELNIHNNNQIFGYVYRAYLIVSGYAAFAWIIKLLFLDRYFKPWQSTYELFIPNWQWSSAFLFSFTLFYLHRLKHYYNLQIFEEFNELILSWGLLAFFGENYYREKAKLK